MTEPQECVRRTRHFVALCPSRQGACEQDISNYKQRWANRKAKDVGKDGPNLVLFESLFISNVVRTLK